MSSTTIEENIPKDKVEVFTTIEEGSLKDIYKYNKKFNVNVYEGGWVEFDHEIGNINILPSEQTPEGKTVIGAVKRHNEFSKSSNRISVLNDIIEEVQGILRIDINHKFFDNQDTVKQLMLLDLSNVCLISGEEDRDECSETEKKAKLMTDKITVIDDSEYEGKENQPIIVEKAKELKIQIKSIKNELLDKIAKDLGIETSEETAALFIYTVSTLWELCQIGTLLINKLLEIFPMDKPWTPQQGFSQIIDSMKACIKGKVSISSIALVARNAGAAFGVYYSEPYKQLFDRTDDFIEWREIFGSLKHERS